jgi:hypothetical protein
MSARTPYHLCNATDLIAQWGECCRNARCAASVRTGHGQSTRVSSRPTIAISSRMCMPRGFVRICIIGWGLSRSWYRRCANGARTFCRWRDNSLLEPPNDSGKRRRRLRPRRRTCCYGTHGPGMFANWRTRSSGPSSSRGLIASQTTCRRKLARRLQPFTDHARQGRCAAALRPRPPPRWPPPLASPSRNARRQRRRPPRPQSRAAAAIARLNARRHRPG